MKVKLYSQYNHFPGHIAAPEEPAALELWNDGKIWEYIDRGFARGGSALLIEPRSLQPQTYRLVENYYHRFDNIFTHDSQLLAELPNAQRIIYWNEYEMHDEPKTKNFSMICGSKDMCPLHNLRQHLAEAIKDRVDILGDWKGGSRCSIAEAYANYKFAVVIENYIDDYWFTEKILNAFASKTVPIYLGARKIGEFFNPDGIIQVENLWQVVTVIEYITASGIDREYSDRAAAIEGNYLRVHSYRNFEEWFFYHYGDREERNDIIYNNPIL